MVDPERISESPASIPVVAGRRDWTDSWLWKARAVMRARGLSERTQRIYLAKIHHLLTTTGRPPSKISSTGLRAYLDDPSGAGAKSPAARSQVLSVLRFLFRDVTPRLDLAPLLRGPKNTVFPPPRFLTQAHVLRLLASAESARNRVLFGVLYGSGVRLAELLALRLEDVDTENKTLWVRSPPGKHGRITVLSGRIREDIRCLAGNRPPHAFLFAGTNGSALAPRTVQKTLVASALRAGLTLPVNPRLLRKSFAVALLEHGVHPATVQALMNAADSNYNRCHVWNGGPELPPGVSSPL